MTTQRNESNASRSLVDNHHAMKLANSRPLEIQVLSGTAYLTQEGDAQDYVLNPGQSFRVREHGSVVVQGLPVAEICTKA